MNRSTFRRFSIAWLAAGAVVLGLTGRPASFAAPASLTVPVPYSGCLYCADASSGCEPGNHDAFDMDFAPGSENHTRNGGAHIGAPYCHDGSCATMHGPECVNIEQPSATALESLRVAILNQRQAGVADFLEEFRKSSAFDFERSAIQLLDCQGQPYAHLPLAPDFARSLHR